MAESKEWRTWWTLTALGVFSAAFIDFRQPIGQHAIMAATALTAFGIPVWLAGKKESGPAAAVAGIIWMAGMYATGMSLIAYVTSDRAENEVAILDQIPEVFVIWAGLTAAACVLARPASISVPSTVKCIDARAASTMPGKMAACVCVLGAAACRPALRRGDPRRDASYL